MSADLYLIAHKVRGEPAFDVATRMECGECRGLCTSGFICNECDSQGYWWIIPTSGHRAYPWWHQELSSLMHDTEETIESLDPVRTLDEVPPMPEGLPDHYATRAAPTVGLAEMLGMSAQRAPAAPIKRRF